MIDNLKRFDQITIPFKLLIILNFILGGVLFSLSIYYFIQIKTYSISIGEYDVDAHSNSYLTNNGFSLTIELNCGFNCDYQRINWNQQSKSVSGLIKPDGSFNLNSCVFYINNYLKNAYLCQSLQTNFSLYGAQSYGGSDSIVLIETQIMNMDDRIINQNDIIFEAIDLRTNYIYYDSYNFVSNDTQTAFIINLNILDYNGTTHYNLDTVSELFYVFLNNMSRVQRVCEIISDTSISNNIYVREYWMYKTWYEILTLSVSITSIFLTLYGSGLNYLIYLSLKERSSLKSSDSVNI